MFRLLSRTARIFERSLGTIAPKKDVVIIGSGHNGLVCAAMLAKKGLSVLVVEEQSVIGGATRTEKPFKKAPNLGCSTASYLLGLMPPEVEQATGVKVGDSTVVDCEN